jgi:hypothetical protein
LSWQIAPIVLTQPITDPDPAAGPCVPRTGCADPNLDGIEGRLRATDSLGWRRSVAKFWLTPVSLASNVGFRSAELTALIQLVAEHRLLFQEKWNEYFGH